MKSLIFEFLTNKITAFDLQYPIGPDLSKEVVAEIRTVA